MIRNLINHPVKHNVIFNINNGEEVGLYGAGAFMKHPWSKDVKAFVNLGKFSSADINTSCSQCH
jgi:Zn-dependent M28 family amino/carboxypeptidase